MTTLTKTREYLCPKINQRDTLDRPLVPPMAYSMGLAALTLHGSSMKLDMFTDKTGNKVVRMIIAWLITNLHWVIN